MLKVLAHHSPWNRGYEVAIVVVSDAGDVIGIVEPLAIKNQPPDAGAMLSPTLAGPPAMEFLQSALETAWGMGLRPKNWRLESTEQVAAMDNHLQDMRALVFGPVPIDLPRFYHKKGQADV